MGSKTAMTKSWANLIFAGLFLLLCCLPLVGLVLPGLERGARLNEKRELAASPVGHVVKLADLPARTEAWFNDHFGYRSLMVRLNSFFHYRVFNASSSHLVLPGRERWLFYDGRGVRGGDPRRNHLARLPRDHEQTFRALKEQFEFNDRYFAERGLTYLIVVVPDKWSVYREELPRSVGEAPDQTSGDLFLAYLKAESDLKILDLKEFLRRQRETEGPIYHRIDSHWNDLGAYLSAGEMARFAGQWDAGVKPLTGRPEVSWSRQSHGDLATLMGLDGWLSELEPTVSDAELPGLTITKLPKPSYAPKANRHPIRVQREGGDLPNLVILRDSYGDALLPWLSRSFGEVRWLWTSNYKGRSLQAELDEVKPKFVIEEKAEKYLMYPIRYYTAPGQRAVTTPSHKKSSRR